MPDPEEWCSMLRTARTTRDLVEILTKGMTGFTPYDLQLVQIGLHRETGHFPRGHRDEVFRIMGNYLFMTRDSLISRYQVGNSLVGDAELAPCFGEFCNMVAARIHTEQDPCRRLYSIVFFSVSAFSIFVLKHPGHPVGMPFPGGARLEEIDHAYYCPVKRADCVWDHTICQFCCAVPLLQPAIHGYAAA